MRSKGEAKPRIRVAHVSGLMVGWWKQRARGRSQLQERRGLLCGSALVLTHLSFNCSVASDHVNLFAGESE